MVACHPMVGAGMGSPALGKEMFLGFMRLVATEELPGRRFPVLPSYVQVKNLTPS